MITLLPTYIENTRAAILNLGNETKVQFKEVESLLMDDSQDGAARQSLKKVMESTEKNILRASTELKDIVVESGNMAESLFERVDSGYKELEVRKFGKQSCRKQFKIFLFSSRRRLKDWLTLNRFFLIQQTQLWILSERLSSEFSKSFSRFKFVNHWRSTSCASFLFIFFKHSWLLTLSEDSTKFWEIQDCLHICTSFCFYYTKIFHLI